MPTHLSAEFAGVRPEQLRDSALLKGLLIAAASAARLNPIGVPIVREGREGLGGVVLLDGSHIILHAYAERGLLLLDVLTTATDDAHRVVDVFNRRLTPAAVNTDTRERG